MPLVIVIGIGRYDLRGSVVRDRWSAKEDSRLRILEIEERRPHQSGAVHVKRWNICASITRWRNRTVCLPEDDPFLRGLEPRGKGKIVVRGVLSVTGIAAKLPSWNRKIAGCTIEGRGCVEDASRTRQTLRKCVVLIAGRVGRRWTTRKMIDPLIV